MEVPQPAHAQRWGTPGDGVPHPEMGYPIQKWGTPSRNGVPPIQRWHTPGMGYPLAGSGWGGTLARDTHTVYHFMTFMRNVFFYFVCQLTQGIYSLTTLACIASWERDTSLTFIVAKTYSYSWHASCWPLTEM